MEKIKEGASMSMVYHLPDSISGVQIQKPRSNDMTCLVAFE